MVYFWLAQNLRSKHVSHQQDHNTYPTCGILNWSSARWELLRIKTICLKYVIYPAWSPKASECSTSNTKLSAKIKCVWHIHSKTWGQSWQVTKRVEVHGDPGHPSPFPPQRPLPVVHMLCPLQIQTRGTGECSVNSIRTKTTPTSTCCLQNKTQNQQHSQLGRSQLTYKRNTLHLLQTYLTDPKHAMNCQRVIHYCWKWRQSYFLWLMFKLLTVSQIWGKWDFTNHYM